MKIKVHLPNGSSVEVENNLTLNQIREVVTSAGLADVALSPAVDAVDADSGEREVRFEQTEGATKG